MSSKDKTKIIQFIKWKNHFAMNNLFLLIVLIPFLGSPLNTISQNVLNIPGWPHIPSPEESSVLATPRIAEN